MEKEREEGNTAEKYEKVKSRGKRGRYFIVGRRNIVFEKVPEHCSLAVPIRSE
jgi:hypothetical protein